MRILPAAVSAFQIRKVFIKAPHGFYEFMDVPLQLQHVLALHLEEHPGSILDGSLEHNLEVTIAKDTCTHPGVFRELYIRRGQPNGARAPSSQVVKN